MEIKEILASHNPKLLRGLFHFTLEESDAAILLKFGLWSRYFLPHHFESEDAPLHAEMNRENMAVYRGAADAFVNAAFRGAGKDVKTKDFIAFVILNDRDHFRRFFRIINEDATSATKTVTNIYNTLVAPRMLAVYPDTFSKTSDKIKLAETMHDFVTSTGISVQADTVGNSTRLSPEDASRPDFIWFNDFENRGTLRSAVKTRAIWDNMEEARTGLQKGGGCVYTCNYISEMGNVHRLVTEKLSPRKRILITPIGTLGADGRWIPAWDRYTHDDIEKMRETDDDFEGERLCKPSAAKDVFFDRERLDAMPVRAPIREINGFKIFKAYDPSHRYASGHDVAGGVGLDSSTTVIIDFDVFPCQVVATYKDNTIKPDVFGDEIYRQVEYFGKCLVAPEKNNHGHATIARLKQLDVDIATTERKKDSILMPDAKEYGWETNTATKSTMLAHFRKAIEDGHLELNDPDLKAEAKAYSRNDMMDKQIDPRLITNSTRHFDLLMAAMIAWQMRDRAYPRSAAPLTSVERETKEALEWLAQARDINRGLDGDYSSMG
jgi:hypothetical protein